MSDVSAGNATHKARRQLAAMGAFVLAFMGIVVSGWYFLGAFLCVGFAGLHGGRSVAAYVAAIAIFLLLIGGYQVGRNLAKRDAINCPSSAARQIALSGEESVPRRAPS